MIADGRAGDAMWVVLENSHELKHEDNGTALFGPSINTATIL